MLQFCRGPLPFPTICHGIFFQLLNVDGQLETSLGSVFWLYIQAASIAGTVFSHFSIRIGPGSMPILASCSVTINLKLLFVRIRCCLNSIIEFI